MTFVTHLARVAPPPGGLVAFRRGALWGYADTTGRVVVPPVLRAAPPFSLAGFVRVDSYYYVPADADPQFQDRYKPGDQDRPQRRLFVNARGEFLLAQPEQAALLQPDGSLRLATRYAAGSAGQTELLDVSPEVGVVEHLSRDAPEEQLSTRRIAPPRLERRLVTGDLDPLNADKPDRYTYIVRKRVYGEVRGFRRCSFFVEKRWHIVRSKEALLDERGRRLTPHRYSEISRFGHGLARVWVADTDKQQGGYGLINRRGREVLPPRYKHVSYPNHAGILVVEEPRDDQPTAARRYGLLDTLGRWVVPLQTEVLSDPDATGLVRRQHLRAPADTVVEFLTLRGQPAFADLGLREATGFWAGRAWARTAAGTGLLDVHGQWVVPPGRYQELRPMHVDGIYWPLADQDEPEFAPHRPDDIRLEGDTAPDYPRADTVYWLVRRAGHYGLVSLATGAEVVPCRYDAITCWVGEYGSGTRNHQDYFLTSHGGRELTTGRYRGEWYALPGRGPLFQLHLSPYRWLVCDTAGRHVTAVLPQVPGEHGYLLPDNLVLMHRPADPQDLAGAQWHDFGSAVADTAGHLLVPFRRDLEYAGKPSWLNSAYYWSSSVRPVVPRHAAFAVSGTDGQHLLLARAGQLRDATNHGYIGFEPLAGGWYLTRRAGRSVLLSPEGAEVLAPAGYEWDETLHQVGRVVPFANGTASVAESGFHKPVVLGRKGGLVTRGGRLLWQDETATR